MTERTIRPILAALALAFAMPATYAQGTDTPPAPPAAAAPVDTASPADSTPAPPDEPAKKKPRFRIGPEIGVYLPTSSKARSQFGSAWVSLGLGLGSIGKVTSKGQTAFDLQVLYQTKSGNHIFLAPIGVGYRTAISHTGPQITYVGVTGDLYLADLRSGDFNVHSGIRTGGGVSALLGETFGDSGFLEARYMYVSGIKGFDLSGLNLTAGYRF